MDKERIKGKTESTDLLKILIDLACKDDGVDSKP